MSVFTLNSLRLSAESAGHVLSRVFLNLVEFGPTHESCFTPPKVGGIFSSRCWILFKRFVFMSGFVPNLLFTVLRDSLK